MTLMKFSKPKSKNTNDLVKVVTKMKFNKFFFDESIKYVFSEVKKVQNLYDSLSEVK